MLESFLYLFNTICNWKLIWSEDHQGSDKNSAIFQHIYNCKSCQNTNTHDNFKVLKRCKLRNIYTSESMVIKEEYPILNTQITLNGKRSVLSIFLFKCFKCFCYNFFFNFVQLTSLLYTITNISNILFFTS